MSDTPKKRKASPRMPKLKEKDSHGSTLYRNGPEPFHSEDLLQDEDDDLCYQEALSRALRQHGKINVDD